MCKNSRALMRAVIVASFLAAGLCALSCTNNVTKVVQQPGSGEGLPGGPRPSEPCSPGDRTFAIDAFDTTPADEAGAACDVGNLLDEDGSVTGIAASGGGKATLVGREVNGCIGVEFGEGIVLASLTMKMGQTSGMCGHACTEGGKDGCGTGGKVQIFVGPSFDKLEWLQQLTLTQRDLHEYSVAVHRSYAARFAVICREATPETGDDVAIDVVSGLCGEPPQN